MIDLFFYPKACDLLVIVFNSNGCGIKLRDIERSSGSSGAWVWECVSRFEYEGLVYFEHRGRSKFVFITFRGKLIAEAILKLSVI